MLIGAVALSLTFVWVLFGEAIGQGSRCLANRILHRSGAACEVEGPAHADPPAVTAASTPALGAAVPTVCSGGKCTHGNCFAAGTPVATKAGPRPIEALAPGDKVLSRDLATGEDREASIVARKVTPARETLRVGLDDVVIEVTPEHPFWVSERGWTPAAALVLGSVLVGPEGLRVVRSLATAATPRTVYNVEVEGTHTYFAGGVLVHNDCGPLVGATFGVRDLEKSGASTRERMLVAYWWLRLPNDEREQANAMVRQERLRGDERVGQWLLNRARAAYPAGLPTEMDTGIVDTSEPLVERQMQFDAHVRTARADHDARLKVESSRTPSILLARSPLPAIFDSPVVTEKDPSRALKNPLAGQWMIHHDTDIRLIADKLLEESGIEEKARMTPNPESSMYAAWRNVRDTGKAMAWRAGGGFVAPNALKPEASGEEQLRQQLTQEAFDFAMGVEVRRTEAGAVVLHPDSDAASVAALRTLLDNVDRLAPNGKISRAAMDAAARDEKSPEALRRAASYFTVPVVTSQSARRPLGARDRYTVLDEKDGSADGTVTAAGMQNLLAAHEGGIQFQLAPRLHRIHVRHRDGATSDAVDLIAWSGAVGALHEAELAWLSGKMSTDAFDTFYNATLAAGAAKEAASARRKLDADLERLTEHALDGVLSPDFEFDAGKIVRVGVLDQKYDAYLERGAFERMGIGTWSAVKEVLMIPVGLGELVVYATDHGNPVVLVKGRADGSPLLYTLAGNVLTGQGPPPSPVAAMSDAFDEWWVAAQVEPDRATGQAVGAAATFVISVDKLIRVARLSGSVLRTVSELRRARAAGDVTTADRLLTRARQMVRMLRRTRGESTAANAGREQAALDNLATKAEEAVDAAAAEKVPAVRPAPVAAAKTAPTLTAKQALAQAERATLALQKDIGHALDAAPSWDLPLSKLDELVQAAQKADDEVRLARGRVDAEGGTGRAATRMTKAEAAMKDAWRRIDMVDARAIDKELVAYAEKLAEHVVTLERAAEATSRPLALEALDKTTATTAAGDALVARLEAIDKRKSLDGPTPAPGKNAFGKAKKRIQDALAGLEAMEKAGPALRAVDDEIAMLERLLAEKDIPAALLLKQKLASELRARSFDETLPLRRRRDAQYQRFRASARVLHEVEGALEAIRRLDAQLEKVEALVAANKMDALSYEARELDHYYRNALVARDTRGFDAVNDALAKSRARAEALLSKYAEYAKARQVKTPPELGRPVGPVPTGAGGAVDPADFMRRLRAAMPEEMRVEFADELDDLEARLRDRISLQLSERFSSFPNADGIAWPVHELEDLDDLLDGFVGLRKDVVEGRSWLETFVVLDHEVRHLKMEGPWRVFARTEPLPGETFDAFHQRVQKLIMSNEAESRMNDLELLVRAASHPAYRGLVEEALDHNGRSLMRAVSVGEGFDARFPTVAELQTSENFSKVAAELQTWSSYQKWQLRRARSWWARSGRPLPKEAPKAPGAAVAPRGVVAPRHGVGPAR